MIFISTISLVYVDKRGILCVDAISQSSKKRNVQTKEFGIAPELIEIYRVLETKNIIFEVRQKYLHGEEIILRIPREDALRKCKLIKHASSGLNINDVNGYHVVELLSMLEQGDPPVTVHTGIGFDKVEIEKGNFIDIFKGYKCLGDLDSMYHGDLQIKPKGVRLKAYREFVKTHINDTALDLAFAIGLSSAIVGFIGDALRADNLVAHFCGDSSEGKTTAAL